MGMSSNPPSILKTSGWNSHDVPGAKSRVGLRDQGLWVQGDLGSNPTLSPSHLTSSLILVSLSFLS